MRVGLALPQYDFSVPGASPLPFDVIVDWAVRAEDLGFDSVWLSDHLGWSIERYGAAPGEHGGFEPLATLAALARRTQKIRLGTLVLCAGLRPPRVLAKQIETLAALCGGRLVVGVGAGWYEPDYRKLDQELPSPGQRVAHVEATVAAVREWAPGVPVWVAAKQERMLSLTGRAADGWNVAWQVEGEAFDIQAAVVEAARIEAGRPPGALERSVGLYTLVGRDLGDLERRFERLRRLAPAGVLDRLSLAEWRSGRLVGTVEEVRALAAGWAEREVRVLIVNVGAVPFSVGDPDDLAMVASALA